jgi:hypothetical protein
VDTDTDCGLMVCVPTAAWAMEAEGFQREKMNHSAAGNEHSEQQI